MIFLPPLDEQRAIAHILGTLDDKIELNRRMNETLEAMARALFKSWFVDFDPVRAKAEGRDLACQAPRRPVPNSFVDSTWKRYAKIRSVGALHVWSFSMWTWLRFLRQDILHRAYKE